MEPAPSSTAELETEIRTEVARWGPVIKRAGIHRE
jgi:tripartite-type tricarboxylate transporter receptor subunit TctC